jgi:hypothetical protein
MQRQRKERMHFLLGMYFAMYHLVCALNVVDDEEQWLVAMADFTYMFLITTTL